MRARCAALLGALLLAAACSDVGERVKQTARETVLGVMTGAIPVPMTIGPYEVVALEERESHLFERWVVQQPSMSGGAMEMAFIHYCTNLGSYASLIDLAVEAEVVDPDAGPLGSHRLEWSSCVERGLDVVTRARIDASAAPSGEWTGYYFDGPRRMLAVTESDGRVTVTGLSTGRQSVRLNPHTSECQVLRGSEESGYDYHDCEIVHFTSDVIFLTGGGYAFLEGPLFTRHRWLDWDAGAP